MADTYTYDATTGEYAAADSTPVPASKLRAALLALIALGQARIAVLSQRLAEGRITLAQFRTAFEAELRASHVAAGALAHGGTAQMDRATLDALGGLVKAQQGYLAGMVAAWAAGTLTALQLHARAQMYATALAGTYAAIQTRDALARGATEGRSVLDGGEHCAGCEEEAAKGWTLLADIVPIGERDCLSRCLCSLETREPTEVAA